jgi:hypothetical protein
MARLKLHYDSKPTYFKHKQKKFLPNVIYVDVLPNPEINARDVYELLKTYALDEVFYIDDDKIFNNKVLLEKKVNQIQNYLCYTSARVYIINSPLLIYDLYHKIKPDEVHFEKIKLFKVKAQHHYLIKVNYHPTKNTITIKKENIPLQEKIHQVFSRFLHATLITINKDLPKWETTLLSKLSVNTTTKHV